jgi:hypothetical protein
MNLDSIFGELAEFYSGLTPGSDEEKSFLAHLNALAKPAEYPKDYPENLTRPFPEEIEIAFAGCRCCHAEFIVDGSTQECQHCGSLMFRYETAPYHRKT